MRADFEPLRADAANEAINLAVVKFGSSVLRDRRDLSAVATEIAQLRKGGQKAVAVVSAFAGETDALFAEAAAAGGAASRHAPRLVALGEEKSAALLAIACEGAGLDVAVLGAEALSLRAGGSLTDAHPIAVGVAKLTQELGCRDAVIIPGFVALNESREPVLLGRGGSDLTAVFLASALGLAETTLMKDVDGVYDRDPAKGGAKRYATLDYARAREVAGKLLQPKAIDFAAAHGVALRVRRLNGDEGTVVKASSVGGRRFALPAV